MELDAEQTARSLRQLDASSPSHPAFQVTDNLRWRLLKERFLIDLEPAAGIQAMTARASSTPHRYKGLLVRPAYWAACSSSPRRVDRGPRARGGGPATGLAEQRIFSDTQARRLQDAFEYGRDLERVVRAREPNADQRHQANPQPYLIDFGAELGPQWVTVLPSPTGARSPPAPSSSPTPPTGRGSGACRARRH